MQFVATIAVVASVLVFALQTRELARQSRVGNEVAGTQAHRELLRDYKQFADVFIQYPELHAYYYDRTPVTPSATDTVRLTVIAEQQADLLETALLTMINLASYSWVFSEWDSYITRAVASSSHLRAMVNSDVDDWPTLEPYVARHDDAQAAPAAPS